jgi:hypothetical protein
MRELFAMDGPKARRHIRKLAYDENVDAKVRLRALVEILDRAFGRPVTPISGADGEPLLQARDSEDLMVAQRIAFLLMQERPHREPALLLAPEMETILEREGDE